MKKSIFIFCVTLLVSCQVGKLPPSIGLVHQVYFTLRPEVSDAERADFIEKTKELAGIKSVKMLSVGRFQDIGDSRALSAYGVIMVVGFEDEAGLKAYSTDKIHLRIREETSKFLASPPAVYDFIPQ